MSTDCSVCLTPYLSVALTGRTLMLGNHTISSFTILLFVLTSAAYAASERHSYAGLGVYSDLNFNKKESEYYGLQIIMISYIVSYNAGQKVLWRSAAGKLNPPVLLDVAKVGSTFKVVVPKEYDPDFFGEWSLTASGTTLYAIGPRNLKFDL